MNEDNEVIAIKSDGKYIIIAIPINTLVFAQENRPDFSCKINNKEKMVRYFKDYFLDFRREDNRGSDLEESIDNFFSDAIDGGEEWIDSNGDWYMRNVFS